MLLPSQLPITSVRLHRDERLGEWRQTRTGDAFRRVWSSMLSFALRCAPSHYSGSVFTYSEGIALSTPTMAAYPLPAITSLKYRSR